MELNSLTKLQQQELIETFEEFGLGEKDRAIYFALLTFDKTTITPLAKVVRFPVTTVQSILIRLEKKGLVNVTSRKSRHVYEAKDPIIFKKLMERKLQDLNNVMPILKKLKTEEKSSTKIRIYQNERMADIFHEALKSKNKMVYEIIAAKDFQDIIGEKFHFTTRRVKGGVHLKSLRVEVREIKRYNKKIHEQELREAKFLPRELTFKASFMMWNDTVAFFTTKKEGLAWTVESAVLAETMRQIFEMLWSVSRRMETI